jgi:hypothetical protein
LEPVLVEEESSIIGPVIGGAAGGLVVFGALGFIGYKMVSKKGSSGTSKTKGGSLETN